MPILLFQNHSNIAESLFVYAPQESRAHHHALEMDGLLSRQAWECLSSSNASSAPATAEEEVGVTLRSEVQFILHQLKECIPQNLECP